MKRTLTFLLVLSFLLLSACSLLPQEESIRVAPIIPEHEAVSYTTATVERIDMELKGTVRCSYTSVNLESLSFGTSDVAFNRYYVQLGDRVKAGQLLAELDMRDINEALTQLRLDLSLIDLQVKALEEDRALALERKKILMEGSSAEDLKAALAEVNQQFDQRKQSFSDEIYFINLQIQEWEDQIPARQIRAGIDGVIRFLYDFSKDSTGSKLKGSAIRIADPDNAYFKASTNLWPYITPGQTFLLHDDIYTYSIVAVSETELGLAPIDRVEGRSADVFFLPQESIVSMEVEDIGNITVSLGSRQNVLAVPSKAISHVGEQTVVYYLDGEGMRAYKPVETGFVANGMTEILSGLEEGETIIVN